MGLEKEPGKSTGHKSCLVLTDVKSRAVMHPVPFWIFFSHFIHFFMVENYLQNHFIGSAAGYLGPSAISKSHSLNPCNSAIWDLTFEAYVALGGFILLSVTS